MYKLKEKVSEAILLEESIIENFKYTVRFAKTEVDVESAMRLRFDVFNLELGEGLASSYESGMDTDKYDRQCHHLIVIENETGKTIGTYRMQSSIEARNVDGFYTGEEFEIEKFPDEILNNTVELGRACIHKDHRNGRVLFLLWRGLAKYLQYRGMRFLFGCCSLTSQDPLEGLKVEKYLRENNFYHPDYFIGTKQGYRCEVDHVPEIDISELKLPHLFRLYLDLGTKVCSGPALDRTFQTIDYLILLDIENVSDQTKTLFFR